jgi:hypothetical protein
MKDWPMVKDQNNEPFPPEEIEAWDFRPRKRSKKRIRRLTLSRAIIEARKAGITAGVLTIDNVRLEFGQSAPSDETNEWDTVQ